MNSCPKSPATCALYSRRNEFVFVLTELEKQMKIENLFVTWQQRSAQSNMPISVSTSVTSSDRCMQTSQKVQGFFTLHEKVDQTCVFLSYSPPPFKNDFPFWSLHHVVSASLCRTKEVECLKVWMLNESHGEPGKGSGSLNGLMAV